MGTLYDVESESVTLADDENTSLEVKTVGQVDQVDVTLDDGTTGNAPSGYELVLEIFDESANHYWEYDVVGSDSSPETAKSWTDPAPGEKSRYRLINRSGGSATFNWRVASSK